MTTATFDRIREPIAALSSGVGAAGVAVVRVSGDNVLGVVANICHKKSSSNSGLILPRQIYHGIIVDPESKETIDDVLFVYFQGPKSYTGQDVIEIFCHGGPFVVQRVLQCFQRGGVRLAEPGEFTRRAFLNGKMDLTQAEGLKELVEAESRQQWAAARSLMAGGLAEKIGDLRAKLIEAMAYLEAQIDFPDEGDTAHLNLREVEQRVEVAAASIGQLRNSFVNGRIASRGLAVAIFGMPNAGKSTLMNTLLGRERAIVSAIPGTTRDYLEEKCVLDGRLVRLLDMAGIRDGADVIEALGVERSRAIAKEADVVIHLIAANVGVESESIKLQQWLKDHSAASVLTVISKVDLRGDIGEKAAVDCRISCKTGLGLDVLREKLVRLVDDAMVGFAGESAVVTTERQLHGLAEADGAIERFRSSLKAGQFEECLAFELQEAARALNSVVGTISNDDILGQVFSSFCLGK